MSDEDVRVRGAELRQRADLARRRSFGLRAKGDRLCEASRMLRENLSDDLATRRRLALAYPPAARAHVTFGQKPTADRLPQ